MKKAALALMVIAACGWAAFAQADEPIVTVKVVPSAELFSPGQSYPFTLEIAIRSPFHINADIPSEDYLIGTTVDFQSVPGVTFGKIAFPPAEMRRFSFSENPLAVYDGTIRVSAEVALAADFKGSEVAIEGTVSYQACNDQSCLPPAEAAFSRKVPVEGSSEGVTPASSAPVNNEIPVSPEKPQASAQETPEETQALPQKAENKTPDTPPAVQGTAKPASRFEGKGLLPLFLLVFLGGLALNLTPCVYPLIPITISYFEVLKHYKVEHQLASVNECLFVPLQMRRFDDLKALRDSTLASSARVIPRPLSLIVNVTVLPRSRRPMRTAPACACRATLVSASCRIRNIASWRVRSPGSFFSASDRWQRMPVRASNFVASH